MDLTAATVNLLIEFRTARMVSSLPSAQFSARYFANFKDLRKPQHLLGNICKAQHANNCFHKHKSLTKQEMKQNVN